VLLVSVVQPLDRMMGQVEGVDVEDVAPSGVEVDLVSGEDSEAVVDTEEDFGVVDEVDTVVEVERVGTIRTTETNPILSFF
jgi:hypothetical protein